MILFVDSTKQNQIIVELRDQNQKRLDKISQAQVIGSQVLLSSIVKLLKRNRITFQDLSAMEVNIGPGSFTGTRVGVTVANTLGFALNIPVNGKKGKIAVPKYEQSKFD